MSRNIQFEEMEREEVDLFKKVCGEGGPTRGVTKPGRHFDQGKVRMDLVDPNFVEGLAKVLTFGATKYGDNNWKGGIDFTRILGSIDRHLNEIKKRNDIDKESGLPHIHHIACNLMFLSWYVHNCPHMDDRSWK